MANKNKIFTFYWKDGVKQVFQGLSAANALIQANIPRDRMPMLSFYEEGKCDNYEWWPVGERWAGVTGLTQE